MTDWLKLENRIRATPLDLLKQGLEQLQWEAVQAAYLMLTGVNISIKEQSQSASIEEDQLVDDLEEEESIDTDEDIEEEEDEQDDELDVSPVNKYGSNKIKTRSARVSIKGGKNRYKDDSSQAIEDLKFAPKEDILKKRNKKKRNVYKKVKAICRNCGLEEKIDPSLAPTKLGDGKYTTRYLCNDCSCGGR